GKTGQRPRRSPSPRRRCRRRVSAPRWAAARPPSPSPPPPSDTQHRTTAAERRQAPRYTIDPKPSDGRTTSLSPIDRAVVECKPLAPEARGGAAATSPALPGTQSLQSAAIVTDLDPGHAAKIAWKRLHRLPFSRGHAACCVRALG